MIITDEEIMRIMNLIANAYIKVMGKEKWDSLTKQEKHDVIMILARDVTEDLQRCDDSEYMTDSSVPDAWRDCYTYHAKFEAK